MYATLIGMALGFPGRDTSMHVHSCVWSEPGPFASTSSVRDSMALLRSQRAGLQTDRLLDPDDKPAS